MIQYVTGDLFALLPKTKNRIFIPHIVNNVGAWGSGFVIPLGRKWPVARERYLSQPNLPMGTVDFVKVEEPTEDTGAIWVCNMVGQSGTISPANPSPIKYAALISCLHTIGKAARDNSVSDFPNVSEIHAPKFGSLRAGGNWDVIETLIVELLGDLKTTIYEYQEK
jgi:hypothetical protein